MPHPSHARRRRFALPLVALPLVALPLVAAGALAASAPAASPPRFIGHLSYTWTGFNTKAAAAHVKADVSGARSVTVRITGYLFGRDKHGHPGLQPQGTSHTVSMYLVSGVHWRADTKDPTVVSRIADDRVVFHFRACGAGGCVSRAYTGGPHA